MRRMYHRKTTEKVAAVLFTVCNNQFMVGRNHHGVKIFSRGCELWLVAKISDYQISTSGQLIPVPGILPTTCQNTHATTQKKPRFST